APYAASVSTKLCGASMTVKTVSEKLSISMVLRILSPSGPRVAVLTFVQLPFGVTIFCLPDHFKSLTYSQVPKAWCGWVRRNCKWWWRLDGLMGHSTPPKKVEPH